MTGWPEWLEERALDREARGLARRLVESDAGAPLLDLAGNDYLGLAGDPRVAEGAVVAARRYGAGARASRLVTGTLALHTALEERLAEFTGAASGLVLSTGYHANLAVVAALADRDTLVVSDAHVHASMVDACRLSRARLTVVPHNDVAAVEAALTSWDGRALVLAESVYSVLGDRAPLEQLAAVCGDRGALLVADEAHGLGVVGHGGRGVVHEAGLAGVGHVVVTATLSKALGSQGGVVLGPVGVRDHLVNTARPFVYDTGLAPPAAGAALAALAVLEVEPERVAALHRNAASLADSCGIPAPPGAVMSVPVAGPDEAVAAVRTAAEKGVRIGCFRPPSTPDGSSRLRLTAHAHHTATELALADEVLAAVVPGAGGGAVTRVVVVTGTGTDVGKTVVTAALAATYVGQGRSVCVVKPAQTGVTPEQPGDLDVVRRLAGPVTTVEPVRLPDPLAPDLAARVAGRELPSLAEQQRTVLDAAAGHDVVLVEGAGGVAVRLGEGWTLLDLATAVRGPAAVGVVVVATAGLGTLNHSVLTVQALRAAGLPVDGIVLGAWPADPGLTERLNREELPGLTGVPLLGAVPAGVPTLPAAEFRAAAPTWFDELP